MQFDIIDHNVSSTTNVFLIIANIINLFYNIPQMYKTYKRKTTKDLSGWFLLLRIIGNSIWIEYAIEVDSLLMLINNIVTVLSSIFVGYYKLIEILNDRNNINDINNINNKNNINEKEEYIEDIENIENIEDKNNIRLDEIKLIN
jgi:MtN3 and saliva related transmembrane protein